MEIVIHGTKGGYKSCLNSDFKPSFYISDIQSNVNSEFPIGKFAYSVGLISSGCVFTKYLIIRDTLRSKATGTIAVSLYIASNVELRERGSDRNGVIKEILDTLLECYRNNYIRENNINRGETTLIREDWTFIDKISSEYYEHKTVTNKIIQTSGIDNAYAYYSSDSELEEYLSKPNQPEYRNYHQIILVPADLKDKRENPLNVLEHSENDLTNVIDFGNDVYHVINFDPNNYVRIIANGNMISRENNIIRKNWIVQISYLRNYFEEIIIPQGNIGDKSSEIHNYLLIIESNKKIEINYGAFKPKEKLAIVRFQVFFVNDRTTPVKAFIIVDDHLKQFIEEYTFSGEQIGKKHHVQAVYEDITSEVVEFSLISTNDIVEIPLIYNNRESSKGRSESSEYRIPWLNILIKKGLARQLMYMVGFLAIITLGTLLIWDFFKSDDNVRDRFSKENIVNYVEGDSLLSNRLNELLSNWISQEQDFIKISGDGIFQSRSIDSMRWKSEWKPIKDTLDLAISKREFIDTKNFEELLHLQFSDKQAFFIDSIKKVDPSQYELTKEKLGDVSSLTLMQFVESLNQITSNTATLVSEHDTNITQKSDSSNDLAHNSEKVNDSNTYNTDNMSANGMVMNYINGGVLDEEKLRDYLNMSKDELSAEIRKSIKICLEFCNIVDNDPEIDSFKKILKKVESDKNLKESNLKKYLESVCTEGANPSFSKQDIKNGLKNI